MKKGIGFVLCVVLMFGILITGCAQETGSSNQTLTVAIYPYVPDQQLFKDILSKQWAEIEPDVKLNFKDWDCYVYEVPEDIDVLMYDAQFGQQLVEDGYIQPIEKADIESIDGFLPFALEGAIFHGEYYGVPFLVCSEFLMYEKTDAEVAAIDNMEDLCELIAAQRGENENWGLSTNYMTNLPYYYIDAYSDHSGQYSIFEEIPAYDPDVMELLENMKTVLVPEPADERVDELGTFSWGWMFGQGVGRVHFGYSEDMALMEDRLDELDIKSISYSNQGDIPLFFVNTASMTPRVTDSAKRTLCIQLMNLIGSEAFQQELCFGSEEVQYMLPARSALYALAAEKYPMYERLEKLVLDERNRAYLFGPDVFEYLNYAYEGENWNEKIDADDQ